MRAVLVVPVLFACNPQPRVTVNASGRAAPVFEDYVERTGHPFLEFREAGEGKARGRGLRVVVLDGALQDCAGCYRLERRSNRVVEVHAGDVLGAQYGVTALLEAMDVRFFHPNATFTPLNLELDDDALYGKLHEPAIARRGLHMHTLHPIEGLFDFWEPDPDGLERAKDVVDWAVRQRANHIQWVALDDIQSGDPSAWRDHTRQIIDFAHERGMTTGLGIQLFGSGNLQLAWDLLDEAGDEAAEDAEMRARLEVVSDLGFDVLNLSFGEFFAEDPAVFIDTTERAYDAIQDAAGPVDVPAAIHVGNFDDLRVEWNGQEMLYYFLAAETDRDFKPWIHSVMYYNLFEDAGGAYLHDEFDEHRAFLLDALKSDEPVGYFPETAYWVAFDINVPTYLPVYVRSRWTDLDQIRQAGPGLQDHVLFSSGWEWGYWQNDYATLRASYEHPAAYRDLFDEMFAPYGNDGERLSDAVVQLADLQHHALIEQRLAAYLAGREAVIDVGRNLGIVSQPDRPQFDEVAAYSPTEAAGFEQVLADLDALATGTRAILVDVQGLEMDAEFADEIVDGIEVDALRTEFARDVFTAALEQGRGGDAASALASAETTLDAARTVVERRHAALWDPDGARLIAPDRDNATIYDFGYLARADELCFWERELVQVRNLVDGSSLSVPPCT